MKKIFIGMIFLAAIGILAYKIIASKHEPTTQTSGNTINNRTMQITSSAFSDNQPIPPKYTCDGENINPPLKFSDVPKEAQTLALIVDDPDAPMGTWVHWTLWDIPTSVSEIAENSVPSFAIQGQTSSGQKVYGGPCPPSGTHHYFFKLFALDTKLSIPSYSTSGDLQKAMEGHIVSQAQLIGLYSKK